MRTEFIAVMASKEVMPAYLIISAETDSLSEISCMWWDQSSVRVILYPRYLTGLFGCTHVSGWDWSSVSSRFLRYTVPFTLGSLEL